jgi:hypothetical protein
VKNGIVTFLRPWRVSAHLLGKLFEDFIHRSVQLLWPLAGGVATALFLFAQKGAITALWQDWQTEESAMASSSLRSPGSWRCIGCMTSNLC